MWLMVAHKPVFVSRLKACRSCRSMHSFFWRCSKCKGMVCNKCLRLIGGQAFCKSCAGISIDPLHIRTAVVLFVFALSLLFLVLV